MKQKTFKLSDALWQMVCNNVHTEVINLVYIENFIRREQRIIDNLIRINRESSRFYK